MITDERLIKRIAIEKGCCAVIATTGNELQDDREAPPVLAALARLKAATPEYPRELLLARRIAFIRRIEGHPIEARLAAIDAALSEPLDLETVNNLLKEKAELLIQLEKE